MDPSFECQAANSDLGLFFALLAAAGLLGVGIWSSLGFLLFRFWGLFEKREQPPLRVFAKVWLREWWSELATLLGYPLGLFPPFDYELVDPAGGPPVVLVHGFARNRACLFVLYWRLRRYGYKNVYPINLLPTTDPIDQLAERLAMKIRLLSQLAQGQKVIVVGHSMGGIAARWCLNHAPDLPVSKLITIASPHQGTYAAYFGLGKSAEQMQPQSPWLSSLADCFSVSTVSLYSNFDNIVIPYQSAVWGKKNVGFENLGHMTMLFDVEVFDVVLQEIAMSAVEEVVESKAVEP